MATSEGSAGIVRVVRARGDPAGIEDSEKETFAILEELREVDSEEYDEWYRILSSADVETPTSIPVFEISWQHLIGKSHGRLLELVIIASRFRNYLDDTHAETIVISDDLDVGFRTVIREVGESVGCEVRVRSHSTLYLMRAFRIVSNSLLILPFLLDQLLATLVPSSRWRNGDDEVIFVPALGRLDSMAPVLEAASFANTVVVASNASSIVSMLTNAEIRRFNPVPVSAFSTIGCIANQCRAYASITWSVLLGHSISNELAKVVEEAGGPSLPETIEMAVLQAFRARIFVAFCKYHLFEQMLSETACEKIVVGTLAPGGRAAIHAGIDSGTTPYHLPHSIAQYICPNPPPETVQLVSGPLDKWYHSTSPQVAEPWTCLVTGRPYLTELWSRKGEFEDRDPEITRVLVATQPLPHKREFVSEVLEALATEHASIAITVKIHPSESPDDYTDVVSPYDNVVVAESDLFDHLRSADVTVTVSSNVGLESILLETPAIVLNHWQPMSMDPLFARYGPVPALRDAEELREFVDPPSNEALRTLLDVQLDWVQKAYTLDADTVANMVEAIDGSFESPVDGRDRSLYDGPPGTPGEGSPESGDPWY